MPAQGRVKENDTGIWPQCKQRMPIKDIPWESLEGFGQPVCIVPRPGTSDGSSEDQEAGERVPMVVGVSASACSSEILRSAASRYATE